MLIGWLLFGYVSWLPGSRWDASPGDFGIRTIKHYRSRARQPRRGRGESDLPVRMTLIDPHRTFDQVLPPRRLSGWKPTFGRPRETTSQGLYVAGQWLIAPEGGVPVEKYLSLPLDKDERADPGPTVNVSHGAPHGGRLPSPCVDHLSARPHAIPC